MDIGATNQVGLRPQTTDPQTVTNAENRQVLAKAVQSINQSNLWPGRELVFHVDPATRSFTVEVLNSETGEILGQIPSEEVLKAAAELSGRKAQP